MRGHGVADDAMDAADEIGPVQIASSSSAGTGPSVAAVPSASTTSSDADMVDRLAVAERASAGRVVADHSADRGPIAGRDVRARTSAPAASDAR